MRPPVSLMIAGVTNPFDQLTSDAGGKSACKDDTVLQELVYRYRFRAILALVRMRSCSCARVLELTGRTERPSEGPLILNETRRLGV